MIRSCSRASCCDHSGSSGPDIVTILASSEMKIAPFLTGSIGESREYNVSEKAGRVRIYDWRRQSGPVPELYSVLYDLTVSSSTHLLQQPLALPLGLLRGRIGGPPNDELLRRL